jgi:hypothetical protein
MNEEIFLALGSKFISWEEIARIALELTPESTSEIILKEDGRGATPYYYGVEKIKKMTTDERQKVKEDLIQDAKDALKQILKHPGLFKLLIPADFILRKV